MKPDGSLPYSQSLDLIFSHMNASYTLTLFFSMIHFNIILPSTPIPCKWHYATSWKVAGSIPDEVDFFFNLPDPSIHNMALGSSQPLTERRSRNFPGIKKRPERKADNLASINEPNV
jgi:hypothetical protein